MKSLSTLLACAVLAACASAPVAPRSEGLFDDTLFPDAPVRVSADDLFILTDEMKRYISAELAAQPRSKELRQKLVDALYGPGRLHLDYDSERTRTASQAFEAGVGNCLSLVIMTAAFAKHLGVPVRFQRVYSEESWSRVGDLTFAAGHVNLSLGRPKSDPTMFYDTDQWTTIDFIPSAAAERQRAREVDEPTITAMYMNNRAAEALARGQLDDAYAWARAAIVTAPAYTSPYNTLAVVYSRHGNLPEAELALERVLAVEADEPQIMSNLVGVLRRLGRADDADALSRRLAQIEPNPPFHFFDLGMAAMREGDYRAAKSWFGKEVARAGYYHEFHFWLAMADFHLGDFDQAGRQLALAMQNSTTHGEHDLYAAKLARLKAEHAPEHVR